MGLHFLVPGLDESLRVNGRALLSTNTADIRICADARCPPVLAIRVSVESVYLHGGKALMRSGLWEASRHASRKELPSTSRMLHGQMRAYLSEDIEVESQAQMLERNGQSQ